MNIGVLLVGIFGAVFAVYVFICLRFEDGVVI